MQHRLKLMGKSFGHTEIFIVLLEKLTCYEGESFVAQETLPAFRVLLEAGVRDFGVPQLNPVPNIVNDGVALAFGAVTVKGLVVQEPTRVDDSPHQDAHF